MITRCSSSSTSPGKGEVDREAGGRGSASRFHRTRTMTTRARALRKVPTDAELRLWKALRRNQLNGLPFRRQHPIGPYVLDFYCPPAQVAIEIDGGQHTSERSRQHDQERSRWLHDHGIEVIRFWNNEVLSNLGGVLDAIARTTVRKTPSRRDMRADLPLLGGGQDSGGGS